MTTIFWDVGTAYDFFISLFVLHHAPDFGLRPSWAAGVRQRMLSPRREFLEQYQSFAPVPVHWVATLPEPKNAMTVLKALEEIPAGERLSRLALTPESPSETRETLLKIASQGYWNTADLEAVRSLYQRKSGPLKGTAITNLLETWSRPEESGEALLAALQVYHLVFFAEEENRIRPALEAGLDKARDTAGRLQLDELIEQLSGGVHLSALPELKEIIFAPSYWSTPLVFINRLQKDRTLFLFGVRPEKESVVPGEVVPEGLVNALKSLADPTRLRILRYLTEGPQTPAGLSRRLRLRPPTVVHHLRALRLAGLIHITIDEEQERRYASRLENIDGIVSALREFLSTQE